MFDVFYIGKKPGLFAHECQAESITHAQSLSRTRYFWIVNYLADYSKFDFLWEPVPWESHQRHAWASQWQRDSGTYLVPKLGYIDTNYHQDQIPMQADMDLWENIHSVEEFDFSWHPDYSDPPFNYEFGTQWQKTGGPRYPMPYAEHVKYVSQSNSKARACATAIYLVDHMDGTADRFSRPVEKRFRYFDNYKDTLTRLAKSIPDDQEFVWICSSICDYTNFDFSWHPETWQNHMLHVFPSDGEKFGDTFFMHVPTFRSKISEFELMEWYDLNFVLEISVPRRPMPVIRHDFDTHVDTVKSTNILGPLALFVAGNKTINEIPTVPLWREKTKTVVPLSASGDIIVVPKVSVPYVKTQLYDYMWIDKTQRSLYPSQLQDIVFISYDEPQADENWQKLKSKFSRSLRIHGVSGMENALIAAAEISTTPWYFAVFAKTDLADEFEFDYVPDYLQQPKHYVFDCENTVNGLRYGHMGIVMYNCEMVKQGRDYDQELGLDYTLSFPHEVVPLLSCFGRFDSSPYHTWRTAFREVSKLAYFNTVNPSIDGDYRLKIWTTHATGPYAEWCLRGAADGVEFFKESQSDLSYLKKGFRWEWLRQRFVDRWGEID